MIGFGYVRVEDSDESAVETLHDSITEFATAEGYNLKEVFVDRQTLESDLVRAGFEALISELTRTEIAHVLVPDLDHLSSLPTIRMALEAKLCSLGSTVVQCSNAPRSTTGLAVRPD